MWNLNSKVIIFGVTIQVLVLGVVFFTKNTIVWCSEKNHIHSNSASGINHAEEASSRTLLSQKFGDLQSNLGTLTSSKFTDLENISDNADFRDINSMTAWLRYLLVAGGFIGLAGLLVMFFRRKKSASNVSEKPFHLCSLRPVLTPLSYQSCFQCSTIIKHSKNKDRSTESADIWVIEITLSSALTRNKSAAAIKGMHLSTIRLENNFIVVGPYKNKSEAAEVVSKLHEVYNVRGWLTPGN
ncbi:hypothetical protein [Pseudomonas fluorescens]|uniref:SPOR domain-containing protein n=1 Tax=Pseudomonas fluorescens TaxID=294 RepID=A0A5E7ASH0_PSEFL|nr:hypothetical protein [Pseudomonas fluorescens]VVN79497.1 hypothetical protein PS691_00978 [Pseudomonas fluorescens]